MSASSRTISIRDNRLVTTLDALIDTIGARCRDLAERQSEISSRTNSAWWPKNRAPVYPRGSGIPPYEFICKPWATEPERFNVDPLYRMPGINTVEILAAAYVASVVDRLSRSRHSSVVKFDRRDGHLLLHFVERWIACLGVDRATRLQAASAECHDQRGRLAACGR